MPVAELHTTECTVVEGKANQPEQAPDGIEAHRVNFIRPSEFAEFKIVTSGAVRVPLEKSEKSTVVIAVCTAVIAVKRRAANDAAQQAAALARVEFPAVNAARIDSPEKHSRFLSYLLSVDRTT